MIKKSEKLVCAYLILMGEKYTGTFELKNILFTAQELILKANEVFGENIKSNLFQSVTIGRVDSHEEKIFIRGSEDSLNEYFRLACLEEGASYNLRQLIDKLMPTVELAVPEEYRDSDNIISANSQVEIFVKDYFSFILNNKLDPQEEKMLLSSREAVWIAAATLTYNEYIRTNSANLSQYMFSQSSIAKLATVFNSANVMTTCTQVTGQMVTKGKNTQNYSYLISCEDKRRVSASSEAEYTRPEQLPLEYIVNTIDGQKTVQELINFIDGPYTSFVEGGVWMDANSIQNNVQEELDIVVNKIKQVISAYKSDFEKINKEERYKWEAVRSYKKKWNIEAENFAEMYAEAFKEAKNLLAANMYWPYKMVIAFAEKEPNKVRELFKMLYDETIPFNERYVQFRVAFDEFYKSMNLKHYQDLHAISVYLSFEYPEKYFIYKFKVFKGFNSNIDYAINFSEFQSEGDKLEAFFQMCELVLDIVKQDINLQDMSLARLDENCYDDKEFHLLVHDIIYFGSKKQAVGNVLYEGWWPPLEEFNPNLTKQDWMEYILKEEKPKHPSTMQMLKAMLELGGEASCKKIADEYGGSPNRYIGCATNLGRRVKKHFNLPACMDGHQERYFPFPFLGKKGKNNDYVYRMRSELLAALNEIDLSDVSPFFVKTDFEVENINEPIEVYTKTDFLNDVYISEEKYKTCVSRLKYKKNLILQGAPGVGKTFAARRLAWSIIGRKDDSRVEFVQFHQNYSYEDFIMGYRPVDNGFNLEKGIFYEFCIKAKKDPSNDYFFIIDEINRGNMSKIFGELLMLIESDYRGIEIKLAYSKKTFSVPKNLYIIGMMNTADRSLAMIDYALRRRFSFVEMHPGFESEGFKSYQTKINSSILDKLIGRIKALNSDIENDASLGRGFCIGHSYFCNLLVNCDDEILKEIVEYDIIPMLEEYWFDDEAKAKNWSNDLRGMFNG